jgi:hypothetical protein
VGILGAFDTNGLNRIGFFMASGKQYGPYGGPSGTSFTSLGTVYGIFGSTGSSQQTITGLGYWTDAPAPPPAPPGRGPLLLRPPPPPGTSLPPPPLPISNGRSPLGPYGTPGDTAWDDGPFYSGAALSMYHPFGPEPLEGTRAHHQVILELQLGWDLRNPVNNSNSSQAGILSDWQPGLEGTSGIIPKNCSLGTRGRTWAHSWYS